MSMSHLANAWLDASWKASLLLGLAWCVAQILRRPAARHLTWSLALFGALLIPLVSPFAPALKIPVLKSGPVAQAVPAQDVSIELDRTSEAVQSLVFAESPRVTEPSNVNESRPAPAEALVSSEPVSLVVWLLGCWTAVALFLLSPLVAAWSITARLRAHSTPVLDSSWIELTTTLARSLGIRKRVRLRRSETVEVPLTWGWLRPVILIPRDGETWDQDRRSAVLLHELAHIKRRDCLVQQWAQVACALHWHNPLAWIAASRMKREREQACDDAVLFAGVTPSAYAEALLTLASGRRQWLAGGIAAVAMARGRGSAFEVRLNSILERGRSRQGISKVAFVTGSLVVMGLTFGLSTIQLSAASLTSQEGRSDIQGRVIGVDGKAAAGADLILTANRSGVVRGGDLTTNSRVLVLAEAKSNAQGAYTLKLADGMSFKDFARPQILAKGADSTFGGLDIDPESIPASIDIALAPTVAAKGQLIDPKGKPIVGVKVEAEVFIIDTKAQIEGLIARKPSELTKVWPEPATTDASGSFRFEHLPRASMSRAGVDDPRFTWTGLDLSEGKGPGVWTLQPSRHVEGTIRAGDSHKEISNAHLTIYSSNQEDGSWGGEDGPADASGKFWLPLAKGPFYKVTAYPPAGTPYLVLEKRAKWESGTPIPTFDFSLPIGVSLEGRITEEGTGRPVPRASLQYIPMDHGRDEAQWDGILTGWQTVAVADDDGRFQITVIPGKGHLLVHSPNSDYVLKEIGSETLSYGRPGGVRKYAHAIVPYEVSLDKKPALFAVKLKKGAAVSGTITGPENQKVDEAIIVDRLNIYPLTPEYVGHPQKIKNGKFTIHGVDPDAAVYLYFLDPKNKWGATVVIDGKDASLALVGGLPVKLRPCGSARFHLLDEAGKPFANMFPMVNLAVTPGPSRWDDAARKRGELAADEGYLPNVDRLNYGGKVFPLTDDDGRCLLTALIPGAPYRIVPVQVPDGVRKVTEFMVNSGDTIDIPDVVVKRTE